MVAKNPSPPTERLLKLRRRLFVVALSWKLMSIGMIFSNRPAVTGWNFFQGARFTTTVFFVEM